MRYANVAIAAPVHSAFTYAIPEGMDPLPGMRIEVPFRRKHVVGICLEVLKEKPASLEGNAIKEIVRVLDETPALSESLIKLVRWMSSYYCAPIGEVCRAALPARLLASGGPKTTRPCSPLEIVPQHEAEITLTEDQRSALDGIVATLGDTNPAVSLLHGITGSGKTEIYLLIFEELKKHGRQGLLLVPEIGLTPQLTGRAVARFHDRVAVYHSGLTDAQRHAQWLLMREGKIDVVIGTRSALFAPLPKLGAIVVDEEHDGSYKQDDGVAYNGRDTAVMRAHIENVPVILGSATPSLESMANAKSEKYRYHHLPTRPGGASLPVIEVVDMRSARRKGRGGERTEGDERRRELVSLSPRLYDAVAETLDRGEQSLLYIGRRGFAGSLQCDSCGEVVRCPNCDIALTMHRAEDDSEKLACHYCGYAIKVPPVCPSCSADSLIPLGHGTQRLEAELVDFFPGARIARFDSDTAGSPAARKKILDGMRRRSIDILVGTQMVTKGHDFPGITLVGVVSADVSLYLPDFRAAERTFQLLTQVAGRAGRGDRAGHVIIQTREPNHFSFIAAQEHDTKGFVEQELCHRKKLSYPPFSRLANIRLSGLSDEKVEGAAARAAEILKRAIDSSDAAGRISILGPAPAPIHKLRGRHRWQILIKAPTAGVLTKVLASARPIIWDAMPSAVRFAIDVDPSNML